MLEFTVLIPVYNTKVLHLEECWQSLQNQTLKPKEIIIVDDGSTDAATINYLDSLSRNGLAVVKTLDKNYGTSHALNVGHGICTTEYIALQGSDDISNPKRFEKQITAAMQRPDLDVIGTQIQAFYDHDPKRKNLFRSNHKSKPKPGLGWQTNHGTVLYKNSAVKAVGGYNVEKRRAQDIDLFNRMMNAGHKFYNLHEVMYLWRRYLRT